MVPYSSVDSVLYPGYTVLSDSTWLGCGSGKDPSSFEWLYPDPYWEYGSRHRCWNRHLILKKLRENLLIWSFSHFWFFFLFSGATSSAISSSELQTYMKNVIASVADPWHFSTDPDLEAQKHADPPDPYPQHCFFYEIRNTGSCQREALYF